MGMFHLALEKLLELFHLCCLANIKQQMMLMSIMSAKWNPMYNFFSITKSGQLIYQ